MILEYIYLFFFDIVLIMIIFLIFRIKIIVIVKEVFVLLSKEYVIVFLRKSLYCFVIDGSSDEDEKFFLFMFR